MKMMMEHIKKKVETISGILNDFVKQGVGDEVIEEMLLKLFRHQAFHL